MKKIMFNDKLHLTTAVINGNKTSTLRLVTSNITINGYKNDAITSIIKSNESYMFMNNVDGELRFLPKQYYPKYKVGEVVAIAQRYSTLGGHIVIAGHSEVRQEYLRNWIPATHPGWNNKSYVKAEYMQEFIKIKEVYPCRLRDIVYDEDACIEEGISRIAKGPFKYFYIPNNLEESFHTCGAAFREMIIKLMGLKVWNLNPWVWRYKFERVQDKEYFSISL